MSSPNSERNVKYEKNVQIFPNKCQQICEKTIKQRNTSTSASSRHAVDN